MRAALWLGGSAILAGAGACVYYATYGVRSQWLGRTDWRGPAVSQSVALTFDDGPAEETEPILDRLAAAGVRATFFLIGRNVERRPAIARRIVAEGHEIGNHSYSHPIYLYRTPRETHDELARTQDVIADATGVRPVWARPPCGVRTPAYFRSARELGLRTVQWTVAGFDWKPRPAAAIAHDVLRGTSAGSIILLHDGDSSGKRDRRPTVGALPAIIDGVRARGLDVLSLEALLRTDEGRAVTQG